MPLIRIRFLTALALLLASCRQHAATPTQLQSAPLVHNEPLVRQRDLYAQLAKYYESLISTGNITIDTIWYVNVAPADRSPDEYALVCRPQLSYEPPSFVDFPFTDIQLRYHEGAPKDYFTVRGQRIRETVYTSDNAFPINSIRRFHYKGGFYLVFNGHLQQCNGYGDRINFNYFFDLSSPRITADMYENHWGQVFSPFMYGDLNDDDQLDRIRFDGIMYPQWGCADSAIGNGMQSCPDTITITAETYRNKKWQPLRDEAAHPYFIRLLAYEDHDTAVLSEHRWMHDVKSPF